MTKYKSIKVDGVKHDYHRWLMEQTIGRKLRSDEVVHHINEDSLDNDIGNLRIMSLAEHSRMHATGKRASAETKEKMRRATLGNPYGPPRKLTDEQVRYIRDNYIPYDKEYGTRAMATKFNVPHSKISRVLHYKLYRDVK